MYNLTINLSIDKQQLEKLVEAHPLCEDVNEMMDILDVLKKEISNVHTLSDLIDSLDLFNY